MSNDIIKQVFAVKVEITNILNQAHEEMHQPEGWSEETKLKMSELCKDKENILTQLGNWYNYNKSKLDGLNAEYAAIREAMDANEKHLKDKNEFIKFLISSVLDKNETDQVVNNEVYIYNKKSVKVEVEDPEQLPIDYIKMQIVADKNKIEEALKGGAEIVGAKLITEYHPQIKIGGEKAIKNAQKRIEKK